MWNYFLFGYVITYFPLSLEQEILFPTLSIVEGLHARAYDGSLQFITNISDSLTTSCPSAQKRFVVLAQAVSKQASTKAESESPLLIEF